MQNNFFKSGFGRFFLFSAAPAESELELSSQLPDGRSFSVVLGRLIKGRCEFWTCKYIYFFNLVSEGSLFSTALAESDLELSNQLLEEA